MLFDKQLMFSEAQSLVQDAGTYYSNIIDTYGGFTTIPQTGPVGAIGEIGGPRSLARFGSGKTPWFWAVMNTLLSTGSSPTLRIYVESSATKDADKLTSSITTHYDTTALAASVLVAGYNIRYPLQGVILRYLQLKFVIGTATTTTGTITAGITYADMIPTVPSSSLVA